MLVLLLFIIFTYAFLITDKKLRKNVFIIIESFSKSIYYANISNQKYSYLETENNHKYKRQI